MRWRSVVLALCLGAAPETAMAASGGRAGPRGAMADPATVDAASEQLAGSSCRDRLIRQLRAGTGDARGCEDERRRIGRALVRRRGVRFGYVERREVELWAVDLVLGEARGCRTWPLRAPGRAVLDPRDVNAAGCRARRYRGPVAIALVDEQGQREELPALVSDADGRLRVVMSEVDASARFAGLGGLRRWRWIELGEDGWAGRIDLARLHGFLADWHLRWVAQGRGVPGLFAVKHPSHEGAEEARTLAVEAQMARQRDDYEAVRAHRLSVWRFLARHPWSPFRREVERLAAEVRATPHVPSR